MTDIAMIGGILSSVKTAADIAKMLKDSDLSLEKAEMKMKLADLVGSLADAKMEIADIQELILTKDRRIRELEEAQELQTRMEWHGSVYYQQTENGKEGPFCPQCYDNNKKVIRLQSAPRRGYWHCHTCQSTFRSG